MKVSELIQKLQSLDQDKEIYIEDRRYCEEGSDTLPDWNEPVIVEANPVAYMIQP